jgi:predicted SAM-dependent methyltransferase
MSDRSLYVNVGSSTLVLEGFENLDNSVWMRLTGTGAAPIRLILPGRYRKLIAELQEAGARAQMRRHDCRRPLPYADGTVDHILCSHFLEHVSPRDMRRSLSDFFRVLKSGGSAHIVLPDLALQVRQYVNGDTNADDMVRGLMLRHETETWKFRLLEMKGGFGLAHRWMYDAQTATERLATAGFEVAEHLDSPSSSFRADDGESLHIYGIKT